MVKCLRRHWGTTVYVVTADSNPHHLVAASLLSDRHIQMPSLKDAAFPEVLDLILGGERITDYILLHDAEFAFAEQVRPKHSSVSIWSSPIFPRLAHDKVEAQNWLERLGLPVPLRYDVVTLPEHGEFFAKPRRGFGSRGASRQPVEVLRAMPQEALHSLMVQEVCSGPEITVDSFYDAETGTHRAVMRERLSVRSGICLAARLFEDHTFSGWARRIGTALGQRGTICFQIMRASAGWAITDLNLRPGAGTAMSIAAGIDLLGAAVACRWGEPYAAMISRTLPAEGVFVTRHYEEFVMS
jgi:hypothetical protein